MSNANLANKLLMLTLSKLIPATLSLFLGVKIGSLHLGSSIIRNISHMIVPSFSTHGLHLHCVAFNNILHAVATFFCSHL